MKKLFSFFLIVNCWLFVACTNDEPQSSSKDSSNPSEFVGKWIDDNVDISWALTEADNYHWEYQELKSELKNYQLQANWNKITQLENELKNLDKQYKDAYVGSCDVLEIGNSVIKVGRASLYLNPTSSSKCWLLTNAFTQYQMGMEIGLVVEDWQTYRFTMQDGAIYFDNGQECLFLNNSKLVWEGVADYMSGFDFCQSIL